MSTRDSRWIDALATGMLAGLAGGVLATAAGGLALWMGGDIAFGRWVLAGAGGGAALGLLAPEIAFRFVEAVLHVVIGGIAGLEWERPEPSPLAPAWLRAVLLAGVVAGVVLSLF